MGRARIISEQGEGRYTVEIDYGSAERTRRLGRVDMRLYELTLRKTWQAELLADIEAGLPSLLSEMDALITEYVAATKVVPRDPQNEATIKKQIDDKTVQINKQRTLIQEARNALSLTELQYKSAELERGTLEQLNLVVEQGAWCADYTEDATGTVATLEINGESGLTLIAPSAPAPAAADGVMVAREMQSPEQVFWNAAVLPGWQKFKPTYRWGTITALDTALDTATVELAEAKSSAQSLDVNQATVLTAVPVQYMTCNASVFTVGDNVVVGFTGQDWAQPKVIGFLDHPKACSGFYAVPTSAVDNWYGVPAYGLKKSGLWGNYGVQTVPPAALYPARYLSSESGSRQHPGNVTWFSDAITERGKPVVLSWRGAAARYGRQAYYDRFGQMANSINSDLYAEAMPNASWYTGYKPWIWVNGRRGTVKRLSGEALVDVQVVTAGLRVVGAEIHLYVIAIEIAEPHSGFAVYSGVINLADPFVTTVAKLFDIDYKVNHLMVRYYGESILMEYSINHFSGGFWMWETLLQPMYFNASCTKAVGLVTAAWKASDTVNPHLLVADEDKIQIINGVPVNDLTNSGYRPVRMVTVDFDAQTTAFTAEHAYYSTGIEARGEMNKCYGAVDFAGDDLKICMTKYYRIGPVEGSPGEQTGELTGGGHVTTIYNSRTGYDVLINDAVVATQDSGTIECQRIEEDIGAFIWDHNYSVLVPDMIVGMEDGYATTYETLSADMYVAVEVIGGDLRHDCVIVLELLESGTTDKTTGLATLCQCSIGGFDITRTYKEFPGTVTGTRGRYYSTKLRAMQGGIERAVSTSAQGNIDAFPFYQMQSNFIRFWPYSEYVGPFESTGPGNTYEKPELDGMLIYALDTSISLYRSPMWPFGQVYLAQAAFSPDGAYGYIGIGPFIYYNAAIADIAPATEQRIKIGGTWHTITNEIVTGTGPALNAAIFMGY